MCFKFQERYGYISTSVSFLSLTSAASPAVNLQKKNLKQGICKIKEQELEAVLKGCGSQGQNFVIYYL